MSNERAKDHFDTEEELTACLEAAEEYANHGSEYSFVDSITNKVQKYGGSAYMSEPQADWLKRIAARKPR